MIKEEAKEESSKKAPPTTKPSDKSLNLSTLGMFGEAKKPGLFDTGKDEQKKAMSLFGSNL